ncbi:helix-turn-helix transcriptional regulator [Brevibacillus massiliensis]|uniref:helix-turn-helix transcriptional regulator n=1 Tax=Brevibacillus massiliensis TaxID=1118054 RepID=UPI00047487B3|nr:YafY family protein [Brevibacillus massiliensis]
MSKAGNMLSILWLLKQRKRMTASEIADELEINVRTVYRYIDALCASGVPIISDSGHNGGYSLLPLFTEAPLFFDLEEQKAIMHAATFAKEAGYPFSDALVRAVTKLKMYTNQEQLNKINRHTMGFDVIQPPVNAALEASLKELEVSVANGYALEMVYQRGCEPAKTRRIDPYGLVYWKNRWYVMAYCHLRREVRSFRVDHIQALSRTDSAFQRPAEFSARRDFLKNLLPDTDNPEQLISIRIQGRQQALNDLCEHWLLGHALVERSLEHAHFRLEEQAIRTFVPYFLIPYGKAIQVLEPPLLKERLVAITSDLLQFYQN